MPSSIREKPTMKKIMISLVLIALCPTLAAATAYEHGHGALQIFDNEGMAATPNWVMTWVYFMGLSFLAGLFFVKNHAIARWVVGSFLLGIVFVMGIVPALGWPVLSGFIALCHLIFWSPALYMLLKQKPFLNSRKPFALWSGLITGVILFSFIFDIRDAFIYLRHLLNA